MEMISEVTLKTIGVNLGTYFVIISKLRKNTWPNVLFICLILFQTIYALLLWISKCLEICFFGAICLSKKLWSRNLFDKYHVWLTVCTLIVITISLILIMILSLKRYLVQGGDDWLKAGPIMFSHTIRITLFKCVNFPIILCKIFQRVENHGINKKQSGWNGL